MDEIEQKFIYKVFIIRNNNGAIWVHSSVGDTAVPFFSKIIVIVLSQILLHGIINMQ